MLAHIEDVLSQDEGHEDKADEMPAGKNLRFVYKVNENALTGIKETARRLKNTRLIRDPEEVLNELAKGQLPQQTMNPQEEPLIGVEKRKPGKFESDWERRVFVGGNYGTHMAELNLIKKITKDRGYDPVLVV